MKTIICFFLLFLLAFFGCVTQEQFNESLNTAKTDSIDDCLNGIDKVRCISRIASVTNDPTICENTNYFNSTEKNFCYSRVAIESRNFEICFRIINSGEKDGCLSSYMSNTNDEQCNLFSDEEKKTYCYYNFKKCDLLPDDFTLKDSCYRQSGSCEKLTDPISIDVCFGNKQGSPEFLKKTTNTSFFCESCVKSFGCNQACFNKCTEMRFAKFYTKSMKRNIGDTITVECACECW